MRLRKLKKPLEAEELELLKLDDYNTQIGVYEALDECGIYDNDQDYEDLAWDYVCYLKSVHLFLQVDDSNYEEFVLTIINFMELIVRNRAPADTSCLLT